MTDHLLLYVVGPPGVGKSTLMAELTRDCDRLAATGPVPHDLLCCPQTGEDCPADVAIEIGRRREAYSGTDALGMSIHPRAVSWIATRPHRLVLAEGARLGTQGFLLAARSAGYRVCLVHLDAPEDHLSARRMQRGSRQHPSWVKGATTRARTLTGRMEAEVDVVRMDGTMDPSVLADKIRTLDPELEALCST